MVERRRTDRRHYQTHTEFPLFNYRGELIELDRRSLPTRRVNDIAVEEIDSSEYFSAINRYK
jgi:hypothetical protein